MTKIKITVRIESASFGLTEDVDYWNGLSDDEKEGLLFDAACEFGKIKIVYETEDSKINDSD